MCLFDNCHIWTISFVNLSGFILDPKFMKKISLILSTFYDCSVMDCWVVHEFEQSMDLSVYLAKILSYGLTLSRLCCLSLLSPCKDCSVFIIVSSTIILNFISLFIFFQQIYWPTLSLKLRFSCSSRIFFSFFHFII